MIAQVAVSSAVYAIDKPYSYRVPETMQLQPGQRVMLPFGRANKHTEGVVLALKEGTDEGLKPITQVLDAEPLLSERMLRTAAFLRERYFCTFYDALKAILPAGVWFRESAHYRIANEAWRAEIHRQPVAFAVMQALEAFGGVAEETVLRQQFEDCALQPALRYLLRKKLLTAETNRRQRVSDKTERIVLLTVSAEQAQTYIAEHRKSAPLQAEALTLLTTMGECAAKELCYYTGASNATLNRLEALGFLTFTEQPLFRLPKTVPTKPVAPMQLNEEQQTAYEGLRRLAMEEKPGVALLYGVTGSGKTAIYIKLIEDCLQADKTALLLVPEIALTPQLLALFTAYFGERVAVLHSGLRITERYDTWKRIREGAATVILGTRSAVFAPAPQLGLLIVDEEQEHTYKSENSPRYHAREVAIYRGLQEGALVLLGSATPSVDTMHRARNGVYRLFTLENRFNRQPMPPVEIVDMKQDLKQGNASAISEPLLRALRENIEKGEQSILFLNRRGTSRMVACVDCGYVPECPACTVNLTYHHDNGRLMCHYCGHSEPLRARCPQCGGHLKQIGFGTQKVQEQLEQLLPGTEVMRMDADTVSALNPHDKILSRFREEKVPILLGTQMVAKGLNFENVTLVGVLDADMSLYVGSYRASETTFSMLTQVIGRAGRGARKGRALVQTMTPKNQVITLAAQQDYNGFYEAELPLRELRGCPPYADLLMLTFFGRVQEPLLQAAQAFRAQLLARLATPEYRQERVTLLGPAPAQIARLNYQYRCRLILSCRNTRPLRELLAHFMREFTKNKAYRGIGVYADVNSNE